MKAIIKVCVLQPLLVFCCTTFVPQPPAYAQSILEKEVSFNLDRIPLKKALETLETATKVKFVYSINQIDVTTLVSVDTKGKTLAEILDELLHQLSIEYKVQEGNEYIVLSRARASTEKSYTTDEGSLLRAINGKVIDIQGIGLAGVNVIVKGTKAGTATDVRGRFTLASVPPRSTIVFSFIGFSTSEVELEGQTSLTIVLEEEAAPLQEVVVTALGIQRAEKSLSHGTQRLEAYELTHTKSDNMINALNGRVLGLTLFPSASGLGGSAKVVLRGNRSFSQSNQPLYVLDGLPMLNSSNSNGQPNTPFGGQMDGGDGVSNLNSDDLESITVLKGASASALYGSQAANGAILITTKKAAEGKTELCYNANVSVSNISYEPAFQNHYGRTGGNTRDSWGNRIDVPGEDKIKTFFQRGMNIVNAVSLSAGSEKSKTYASFANMHGTGVIPRNALKRNNFTLKQTQSLLRQKLILDAGAQYVHQKIQNTPSMGLYSNPLTGLYLFPIGMRISSFKEQYEFPDKLGYARQNWFTSEDIQQNPWWIVNRNPNFSTRRRLLISGNVSYEINAWLTAKLRGSLDRIEDQYQQNIFSGTQATLSGPNGQFIDNSQTQEQKYADALLLFNVPTKKTFEMSGILGASITDTGLDGRAIGPGLGLVMPDVFIAQNIVASSSVNPVYTYPENHHQLQSVFGSFDASLSGWLHVNLTGRNDWSSNLSFTPNLSYFYPSAGISMTLNDLVPLPSKVAYLKLRANYSEVGNTVPQYVTNPVNYFDNTGSVILSTVAAFETLKPERTKTWEVGTDLRLSPGQMAVTLNFYRSNTFNQFIKVLPSVATGYSVAFVNAGNVQNRGIEFSLGLTPVNTSQLRWTTMINAANNSNRIVDVDSKNGIDKYLLTSNDNTSYQSVLAKGGSYGDIYGITLMRDSENRIILNADGTPRINNGFSYLGNPNPKWMVGWSNTITYGDFSLSFLIDSKIGGQVFSMTQAIMDQYGVSAETGMARDRGFVPVNGVTEQGEAVSKVDPQRWYTSIGGRQGVSELYIYSATVARVREMSLSYSVPISNTLVKSLRVSLTGRNLLFLYRKAPYDPELVMSTGNGMSGIDIFNQPAIRNLGFALNLTM